MSIRGVSGDNFITNLFSKVKPSEKHVAPPGEANLSTDRTTSAGKDGTARLLEHRSSLTEASAKRIVQAGVTPGDAKKMVENLLEKYDSSSNFKLIGELVNKNGSLPHVAKILNEYAPEDRKKQLLVAWTHLTLQVERLKKDPEKTIESLLGKQGSVDPSLIIKCSDLPDKKKTELFALLQRHSRFRVK